ncbi:MAG TPA: metallopeptidase family protein [Candidatus Latescibacteria bacterium]|nr:metallopeptidase family protein [Candidatus Handelsmanbacteria bacterium]HIL09269.1 metallopeptidase family protein [Candidatus Latescibacterota bacterium]
MVGGVPRRAFEKLVEKALERLPEEFRQALDNLAIVIEDWPDPAIVEEITGDSEEVLYGLFTGTPLPERRFDDSGDLPPVIALYQGPLEEDFPERSELAREVEITLVHELAHFMGFDEDTVREYGYE